ncbi:LADA_0F05226g1_1 [Lachancea dasiensis]|uniref:LADA_0F05226g1_1 n=1 Tax=Lachancea dasiensis TaxID=1072105 RepID=A0A1G4JJD1_9SACH|nr:LADA_0F05226g1_1 [Lachancea dasiensis]
MKFGKLGTALTLGLQAAFEGSEPDDTHVPHAMGPQDAARIARKMAVSQDVLHANTIDRDSGTPVSFVEYFAGSDLCHDVQTSQNGNLILLLLNMSSTFQNWNKDAKLSVSVEMSHRHGIGRPPMASPRANYFGELKRLEPSKALEHCFLKRHPDARWWIPEGDHDQVRDGQWFEFDVSEVYFVGGFGDRAYIGAISGEDYHAAFNQTELEGQSECKGYRGRGKDGLGRPHGKHQRPGSHEEDSESEEASPEEHERGRPHGKHQRPGPHQEDSEYEEASPEEHERGRPHGKHQKPGPHEEDSGYEQASPEEHERGRPHGKHQRPGPHQEDSEYEQASPEEHERGRRRGKHQRPGPHQAEAEFQEEPFERPERQILAPNGGDEVN